MTMDPKRKGRPASDTEMGRHPDTRDEATVLEPATQTIGEGFHLPPAPDRGYGQPPQGPNASESEMGRHVGDVRGEDRVMEGWTPEPVSTGPEIIPSGRGAEINTTKHNYRDANDAEMGRSDWRPGDEAECIEPMRAETVF